MSVGSIVDMVVGKIGQLLIEEAELLYGVADEVCSLQEELLTMTSFLQDMEEEGDDERSRTLLKQILQIAYDAEDLVESYIFEAEFPNSKIEDFIKRYSCCSGSVLHTNRLAFEIQTIKVRIDGTMDRWKKFLGETGVKIRDRDQGVERTRFKEPITYPHGYEEYVVGLEKDISKFVGVLTKDETQIKMVSFVGMGGSGKTTLARKLYNHKSIKTHFDCLAWVSITKEWDAREILLDLLKKASGQTMTTDEAPRLKEVVKRLHQHLESRRYLIVLDDMWKKQALKEILPAFPSINDRSKIIVTTRKGEVVDFLGLEYIKHEPRRLSEEESWDLFRNIALIHREENSNSVDMIHLEALGKEMLKKCEGLPLAVVALAGILGKKETLWEWERIIKLVSAHIMEDGRGTDSYGPVNNMLALSYNDLPRKLKPCFLYLTNFREDCKIDVEHLIQMWIAEGFIESYKLHEGDTLEDIARRYLDELIHRCVVQIAEKKNDGMVESISMHDLVRDMCIKKANEQDFAATFTSRAPNLDARVIESRQIAIYKGVDNLRLTTNQFFRSLIIRGCANVDLQLICQNFKFLRVLFLEEIETSDGTLPTGIESLIYLRYLQLRHTNITELPSSIGSLRCLQILESSQHEEVRIPDVFSQIEGLQHLHIDHAKPMEGKLKLHTLKSLQTLWGIKGGDWMLKELQFLSPSVQKLCIEHITSQEQLEAAFQCPSIKSGRLHSLHLQWYTDSDGVVMLKNLEPITGCQHLRELTLYGRIADGLGRCDIPFPNGIKKLVLLRSGFGAETKLAALGKLPSLIILHLCPDSYVGTKWTCCAREFPQLKELQVSLLPNLEEWSIERGAMPLLSKLKVAGCHNLRKLPEGLKFITSLQELTLSGMSAEFKKRVKEGEDAHIIEHVPMVRFN